MTNVISTRDLELVVDGVAYSPDITKAVVGSNDTTSDFPLYGVLEKDYTLGIVLLQDAGPNSVWSTIFDFAGDDVVYVLRPYGNEVPTLAEPHFQGVCTIREPDGDLLGTEADPTPDGPRPTIEVAWPCTRPVKVTSL